MFVGWLVVAWCAVIGAHMMSIRMLPWWSALLLPISAWASMHYRGPGVVFGGPFVVVGLQHLVHFRQIERATKAACEQDKWPYRRSGLALLDNPLHRASRWIFPPLFIGVGTAMLVWPSAFD